MSFNKYCLSESLEITAKVLILPVGFKVNMQALALGLSIRLETRLYS